MAARIVSLDCEITEVRRNGGIPIRIPHTALGSTSRIIVPRQAVHISSISKGILGSVLAHIVEDLGAEVIVDVPHSGPSRRRFRVPKTLLSAVNEQASTWSSPDP